MTFDHRGWFVSLSQSLLIIYNQVRYLAWGMAYHLCQTNIPNSLTTSLYVFRARTYRATNHTLAGIDQVEDILPQLARSKADDSNHQFWKMIVIAARSIQQWMAGYSSWNEATAGGRKMPWLPTTGELQALKYLSPNKLELPITIRSHLALAKLV